MMAAMLFEFETAIINLHMFTSILVVSWHMFLERKLLATYSFANSSRFILIGSIDHSLFNKVAAAIQMCSLLSTCAKLKWFVLISSAFQKHHSFLFHIKRLRKL